MLKYSKRTWLNKPDSPSTGSVVAFDGYTKWRDETIRNIFLQISDCSVSVRLHKTDEDTVEDFIEKLQLLKSEIHSFIVHLNSTIKNPPLVLGNGVEVDFKEDVSFDRINS